MLYIDIPALRALLAVQCTDGYAPQLLETLPEGIRQLARESTPWRTLLEVHEGPSQWESANGESDRHSF